MPNVNTEANLIEKTLDAFKALFTGLTVNLTGSPIAIPFYPEGEDSDILKRDNLPYWTFSQPNMIKDLARYKKRKYNPLITDEDEDEGTAKSRHPHIPYRIEFEIAFRAKNVVEDSQALYYMERVRRDSLELAVENDDEDFDLFPMRITDGTELKINILFNRTWNVEIDAWFETKDDETDNVNIVLEIDQQPELWSGDEEDI